MKYKLYALKPTDENLTRAEKGYHRATAGYLLVYTAGRRPEKAVPVKVDQLSPADSAWLDHCNRQIILETVAKNKNIQKRMKRFLDDLKTELAVEAQKIEGQQSVALERAISSLAK